MDTNGQFEQTDALNGSRTQANGILQASCNPNFAPVEKIHVITRNPDYPAMVRNHIVYSFQADVGVRAYMVDVWDEGTVRTIRFERIDGKEWMRGEQC